jgi:hypothetical protein
MENPEGKVGSTERNMEVAEWLTTLNIKEDI